MSSNTIVFNIANFVIQWIGRSFFDFYIHELHHGYRNGEDSVTYKYCFFALVIIAPPVAMVYTHVTKTGLRNRFRHVEREIYEEVNQEEASRRKYTIDDLEKFMKQMDEDARKEARKREEEARKKEENDRKNREIFKLMYNSIKNSQ